MVEPYSKNIIPPRESSNLLYIYSRLKRYSTLSEKKDQVSWEKVSNVLWCDDSPAKAQLHIESRIGIQNTATFIYTLEELKSLPDLSVLWKASDAELERLGKEIFDTNSKVYGLAYALNSFSDKVKKLARSMHIYMKIVDVIPFKGKEELRAMGLELMLGTALSTEGWFIKLIEDPTYNNSISDYVMKQPSLHNLVQSHSAFN